MALLGACPTVIKRFHYTSDTVQDSECFPDLEKPSKTIKNQLRNLEKGILHGYEKLLPETTWLLIKNLSTGASYLPMSCM